MKASDKMIAPKGAIATLIDAEGEVYATVPLKEGLTPLASLFSMLPRGGNIELSKGCVVVPAPSAHGVVARRDRHESGANPDFKPTSASRLEREMRVTLNRAKQQASTLDAMIKAQASIQRIPRAPSEPAPEANAEGEGSVVE